jgi:hypothetical protein
MKTQAWCAIRECDEEGRAFVLPTLSRDLTICRDKVRLQESRYPGFFHVYPITDIVRVEISEKGR